MIAPGWAGSSLCSDSRAFWGHISAIRLVPVVDGLLAATVRVYDMTLVTRNSLDVEGLGAAVLNPFEA